MTHAPDDTTAAPPADTLYGWWFQQIAGLFGGLPAGAGGAASSGADAATTAQGQIAQALALSRQLLTPLYQQAAQALLANPSLGADPARLVALIEAPLRRFADALDAGLAALPADGTAGFGALPFAGTLFGTAPFGAAQAPFADALKPLALNLERAYGGLADAFGLGSTRGLQEAGRELVSALVTERRARAVYLGLVCRALLKGGATLAQRLKEMAGRGESVDTLLALTRLWARAADASMHEAMQSPEALEASTRLIRAATQARQQQHRLVQIVSESLNVPTRAELDDAYREIQELKRELRRQRKGGTPPQAAVAAVAVAPAPARRPAVKRQRAAKASAA